MVLTSYTAWSWYILSAPTIFYLSKYCCVQSAKLSNTCFMGFIVRYRWHTNRGKYAPPLGVRDESSWCKILTFLAGWRLSRRQQYSCVLHCMVQLHHSCVGQWHATIYPSCTTIQHFLTRHLITVQPVVGFGKLKGRQKYRTLNAVSQC